MALHAGTESLIAPMAIFPSATIGAFSPSDALTDERRSRVISGADVLFGLDLTFVLRQMPFRSVQI